MTRSTRTEGLELLLLIALGFTALPFACAYVESQPIAPLIQDNDPRRLLHLSWELRAVEK